MQYALFLRGINVGSIKVPMAELRQCLTKLGLAEVKTYIQSGNVTFSSDQAAEALKASIEKALSETFHYTAYVLLYPLSHLQEVVAAYPFATADNQHRYVIFCRDKATVTELMTFAPQLDPKIEHLATGNLAVYWQVPMGQTLESSFGKIVSQPKYKETTTNRNLNTLEKMLAA